MSSCPICSRSFFKPFALRSESTVILNLRLIFQSESPCFTAYFVDPGGGGSAGASAAVPVSAEGCSGGAEDPAAFAE